MFYCLYCGTFDHDGASCAKRLKALADHEADWKAFAAERQAFYEAQPVKEVKARTQSTTARYKFTPEARAEYFTQLAIARGQVKKPASKDQRHNCDRCHLKYLLKDMIIFRGFLLCKKCSTLTRAGIAEEAESCATRIPKTTAGGSTPPPATNQPSSLK